MYLQGNSNVRVEPFGLAARSFRRGFATPQAGIPLTSFTNRFPGQMPPSDRLLILVRKFPKDQTTACTSSTCSEFSGD